MIAPTTVDVALYVMATMSIGLGAAAFTVFFLAVSRVVFATGVLPVVIGALAIVAGSSRRLGS
ncbi:MAG TPA: hypothetical protein VK920_01365 [Solirubrobacterales bacterium]|nr:hypothetical protein [Solirubrobacterales bacterium]